MADTITITTEELDARIAEGIKIGVQEAKLEILIGDFQRHKSEEETRWAEMFALVRAFPEKVTTCRDDLESDLHEELENHYVTKKDMMLLRQDLENQNKEISNRFKWTVALIVGAAGVIQFITTMIYLGYQLTKLTGAS